MGDTPELPRVGDLVDRYRVIAEVATGGMAAVFAAQRTSIGGFDKVLALKVILPHLAGEGYFLDMFLDEARIASQIQHPNVVGVFDVVLHRGLPCMVMEYLHGRSFATVLEHGAPMGVRLAVLAAAAEGLAAAHRASGRDGLPLKVVHRDVSPQNVHVGYDGQVRLVDFGIAAARGRLSSTRAGTVKGKLEYLAPEQITGTHPVSAATDAWSFGVMAWQAITGRALFADEHDAATMWNVVHREVPTIGSDAVDPEVARAIAGCLEREPARRTTMDRCLQVLGAAARHELGDPRAAVAAHMAEHFAEARIADDRALERTLSGARLLPSVSTATPRGAGWRRPAVWLGASALGVFAAVMIAMRVPDESAPPPTRDAIATTPDPTPVAAPAAAIAATPAPSARAEPPPEPPPAPTLEAVTASSPPPTAAPEPTRRSRRGRRDEPSGGGKRLFESPY